MRSPRVVVGISRLDGSAVFAGEEEKAKHGMRRVIRHHGLTAAMDNNRKVVRRAESSPGVLASLGEFDQITYGGGREGGGPCELSEPSASLHQLLNRAAYYRRLAGDPNRSELEALLKLPARLKVAARHLARKDILASRQAYARLPAPRIPVWAARDRACEAFGGGRASVRRLDGAAGAAWLDPRDEQLDDWVEYDEVDALPKRPARYSRFRARAEWRVADQPPPKNAVAILGMLGARHASGVGDTRGGAALDAYGYAWAQSLTHAWLSVPLPPGLLKSQVCISLTSTDLSLRIKVLALARSPFARAVGVPQYQDVLTLLDHPLFDVVEPEASCWTIVSLAATCSTKYTCIVAGS